PVDEGQFGLWRTDGQQYRNAVLQGRHHDFPGRRGSPRAVRHQERRGANPDRQPAARNQQHFRLNTSGAGWTAVTNLSHSKTRQKQRLRADFAADGEILMRRAILLLSAGLTTLFAGVALAADNATPHNLILFVPDGLRGKIVTPDSAPAMAEVRDKGVNFTNSHSLFPTFTTANASALATGHYLGDTGDFSNTIFTGYPVGAADGTVTPFLESDPVLRDADEHFGGDYLNEETVLKMARAKGYSTAAIGKLGPTLIFDHTDKIGTDGLHSIVVDDSTGSKNGVPLSQEMQDAMTKAGLALATPSRGDNGKAG